MKSKTNFKQMFLVDTTVYNRINNETGNATFKPIVSSRLHTVVEPSTLNVSVSPPVTSERENLKTRNASVGTMSDAIETKSTGVMTDSPSTIEHHDRSSQIEKGTLSTNVEINDRNLQHNVRPVRNNYRVLRKNHHSVQNDSHTARDKSHTSQERYHPTSVEAHTPHLENRSSISSTIPKNEIILSPSNTSMPLQYITPNNNFQRQVMDFTTSVPTQSSVPPVLTQPQTQPQLMEYTTNLPIQYFTPSALSQPETQSQLMDYTTNLPIQYFTPPALSQPETQSQLMDYTSNAPIQYSILPALPHLQTHSLTPPQLMDYSANPPIEHTSSLALPQPLPDDCEECAVTEYKKYHVDLPFARGLPDNVVFTCTICETNFATKKSLQRHMKNVHVAFNQVEKGIKRKAKEEKKSFKKVKTIHEVIPYLMYE